MRRTNFDCLSCLRVLLQPVELFKVLFSSGNFNHYYSWTGTAVAQWLIIYLFTAIGLLPGGSSYFTCKQNIKLVTTRFKSGGLHKKHVVATWTWEPSQHLLIDTGKPRKSCVEVAGRRTFRVLTSSQQSGIWSKKKNNNAVLQIGRSLFRFQMASLEFFIDIKSFRSHHGPGVDSASNRNEYQD